MGPVYDGKISAVGFLKETVMRHARTFNVNCVTSLESKEE
jgi:hypothetical protein